MSKRWILAGSTDQTIDVFIQDSSSTTGAGLTGLTSATSGLTCYYRKGATGTPTALTLASQTVTGAHADGGFVAVDGTNMPGVYRLDLSDTIVASAGMVTLFLRGAANMAQLPLEIEVVSVNPYDSAAFGLSRLDATVSSRMATYTQPTGFLAATFPTTVASTTNITAGTITTVSGNVSGNVVGSVGSVTGAVGSVTGNVGGSVASVTGAVGSVTGNVGGNVVGSVASVTAAVTVGTNNDKTGYSLTQAFPPNFASLGINSSGHVSRVTLVDTTTTNTDMRGTDNAALAASWTSTRAGYLDSVLLAQNANQRTVQVTGSNHVAADLHESQPGSIHATTFDAGAIDAAALATDAANEIADALLDRANAIETGLSVRGAFRLSTAALVGKSSGAETTQVTFRNVGDTTSRIVATVDAYGNRSAITTDAT